MLGGLGRGLPVRQLRALSHSSCSSSSGSSGGSRCCTWPQPRLPLRQPARAAALSSRPALPPGGAGLLARPGRVLLPPVRRRSSQARKPVTRASAVPEALDALVPLGLDFLTFLAATVLVIPVFKSAGQSPVLGFLFAGVVMGQLGLFRNVEEIEKLSELGVLFLLFEMGLELTIDKLQALAKYAFGLGFLQIGVCTAAFTLMALPAGNGIMTQFMERVLHAPASLAAIRSVDEAVVIAVALSLSSSAFVLQLLKERNELKGQFGQATLGILLAQDMATVPFLVLLPLIEGGGPASAAGGALAAGAAQGGAAASVLTQLGPIAAKTLGGLAGLLVGGRLFLRRIFELVAESRSEETFVALCLLSVTGASLLTQRMGFSDTLGAFGAGVLLAETNFKTQVEADIQPFRGILLGLFFVTTGASLDVALLVREWPIILTLLAGLLALKVTAIAALTRPFGLSKADAIRTGFVLSQGGEFAFVLLALANRLDILPTELNKVLIIVVVLSMALTPVLAEAGKQAGKWVAARDGEGMQQDAYWAENPANNPVVICGFNDVGQIIANMLESPALGRPVPYVAFDLTPARVQAAQEAGFNVLYGDAAKKKVLHAAGISKPQAVAVAYSARQRAVHAVETMHEHYPDVPIYVRAIDTKHAAELEAAGATVVVTAETEAGLGLGARLTNEALGASSAASSALEAALRQDLSARTARLALAMERRSDGVADDASQQAVGQLVYRLDQAGINWPALLEAAVASGRGEGAVAAAAAAGKPGAADGRGVGAALLGAMGGFLGQQAAGQQSGDSLGSMEEPYTWRASVGAEVMPSLMGSLDEADAQPDGATLCPVPWDAMTSEDKEGLSGAGPCAEDSAAAAVPAAQQAAGPESSR